jgi:hypothetical protein
VAPDGAFSLHAVEQPVAPGPGWSVVVFAPAKAAAGPLS